MLDKAGTEGRVLVWAIDSVVVIRLKWTVLVLDRLDVNVVVKLLINALLVVAALMVRIRGVGKRRKFRLLVNSEFRVLRATTIPLVFTLTNCAVVALVALRELIGKLSSVVVLSLPGTRQLTVVH